MYGPLHDMTILAGARTLLLSAHALGIDRDFRREKAASGEKGSTSAAGPASLTV